MPILWQGFFFVIVLVAFLTHIFIYVDGNSHSVSDTFYEFFPYAVPTFLIYLWIAKEKSQ